MTEAMKRNQDTAVAKEMAEDPNTINGHLNHLDALVSEGNEVLEVLISKIGPILDLGYEATEKSPQPPRETGRSNLANGILSTIDMQKSHLESLRLTISRINL